MKLKIITSILLVPALAGVGRLPAQDSPIVRVQVSDGGGDATISGRVLVEAQDGGLVVEHSNGAITILDAGNVLEKTNTNEPFVPLAAQELGTTICADLGPDFQTHVTQHYVICSNASREYNKWCGTLFERLFAGFYRYWSAAGIELHEPEFPLPAIVFSDQQQFGKYATADFGAEMALSSGYYSLKSNRMVLFDLTAVERTDRPRSSREYNQRLAAARFNVATVVHEATHQIAFASGLHRRYADNPMWLTEGMAMFFETPDFRNTTGWKSIGRVNPVRLREFRRSLPSRRSPQSLLSLIQNNKRFHEPTTIGAAYAEAWALNDFLIKTRREDYVHWLKLLQSKPLMSWDEEATRIREFESIFGDPARLDAALIRYIRRR